MLSGIEEGYSYKEIAGSMNMSPHTVHSHIKHVYEKLQRPTSATRLRRRGVRV